MPIVHPAEVAARQIASQLSKERRSHRPPPLPHDRSRLEIAARRAATSLLVRLRGSCRGFPSRGNIFATCATQNFLGPVDFIRGVAMDGEQNAASLQAAFVTL